MILSRTEAAAALFTVKSTKYLVWFPTIVERLVYEFVVLLK